MECNSACLQSLVEQTHVVIGLCIPYTAVNCGGLTNPTNGAVDTSSGTTFMMTATYTCNTGYNVNIAGSDTRTCEATALWTPEAPTCTRE